MTTIYHIAQPHDVNYAKAAGVYTCESLFAEGFIHACLEKQISGVIERYYSNTSGLLMLKVDVDKLDAALVYENTMGGTELFPHIYGEINWEAVTETSAL